MVLIVQTYSKNSASRPPEPFVYKNETGNRHIIQRKSIVPVAQPHRGAVRWASEAVPSGANPRNAAASSHSGRIESETAGRRL